MMQQLARIAEAIESMRNDLGAISLAGWTIAVRAAPPAGPDVS